MNEVRDTPITNIHRGTNSFTQLIHIIAWRRHVVRRRNVAINIYVKIVRQTINETLYTHYPR